LWQVGHLNQQVASIDEGAFAYGSEYTMALAGPRCWSSSALLRRLQRGVRFGLLRFTCPISCCE